MHKRKKAKDPDFKPGATHNAGRSTYYKESQSTKAQLNSLLKGDGDTRSSQGSLEEEEKQEEGEQEEEESKVDAGGDGGDDAKREHVGGRVKKKANRVQRGGVGIRRVQNRGEK